MDNELHPKVSLNGVYIIDFIQERLSTLKVRMSKGDKICHNAEKQMVQYDSALRSDKKLSACALEIYEKFHDTLWDRDVIAVPNAYLHGMAFVMKADSFKLENKFYTIHDVVDINEIVKLRAYRYTLNAEQVFLNKLREILDTEAIKLIEGYKDAFETYSVHSMQWAALFGYEDYLNYHLAITCGRPNQKEYRCVRKLLIGDKEKGAFPVANSSTY